MITGQRSQRDQLIVVQASLNHAVELQLTQRRSKARHSSCLHTGQHLTEQSLPGRRTPLQASHACHCIRMHGIKAHGETVHPQRSEQTGPFGREQSPVGGERDLL